jgi:hypothetical protein
LFGLKLRLELIVVGFFLDNILKAFVDGILTEHIGFDLLYLFENGLFVFIIIFIQFITIGLDPVLDKIEDLVRHVRLTNTHRDLLIVSVRYLPNDGIEALEVLD